MTWFKVDDGFADHPKVMELRARRNWQTAVALWTLAGSWSAKHSTDGRVPLAAVSALGGTRFAADSLVSCGLWGKDESGYFFHDWTEYQPTKDAVTAKRKATAERVRRHRDKGGGNSVGNALHAQSVTPPPSRPVPSRPDPLPPNPQGGGEFVGDSGSRNQEVRDGWGEAYFAANAGAVPNLGPTLFAGAVDFACRVAKAHGKPLRQAARDIAAGALARDRDPNAVVFALAQLDPYVKQAPPKRRPKTLGEQLEDVRAEARALHAADRWDEAKPLEKRIDELVWQVKQKGADHVAR